MLDSLTLPRLPTQPFKPGVVVARSGDPITAAGGVLIAPTTAPASCDLLVVPGFDLVPGTELRRFLPR